MKCKNTKSKTKKNQLKISVNLKKLTSYGGIGLLSKFFNKIELKENIEDIFSEIKEVSNNRKPKFNKILQFFLLILMGGESFSHLNMIGKKELIENVFNIEKAIESSTTITRFFNKIDTLKKSNSISEKLLSYMHNLIFENKEKINLSSSDWIGLDSTVITRYGEQEGSVIGYNPKKPGRASHHPLIGFLNTNKYVINLWNRPGNTKSDNNIIGFFNNIYSYIKPHLNIEGVLCDSGFYNEKFIKEIEKNKLKYIIRAVFYKNLQKKIISLEKKEWKEIDENLSYTEFKFKQNKWEKEYRYVIIRKHMDQEEENNKILGKQLKLPGLDDEVYDYRYFCMITNSKDTALNIWKKMRCRSDDENTIKELKDDYYLEKFNIEKFYGTEISMLLRIFLYNIMGIFKQLYLNKEERKKRLKTIRTEYLILPALLIKHAKKISFKISVTTKKLKQKIIYILNRISTINLKIISTAMQ